MARYNTYYKGDDRVEDEMDSAFVGFGNRVRPDQLKAGLLADSKNGRMGINGEWQTRKGISNVVAPLTTGVDALTLPVYLRDSDLTTSSVAVTSNELILNFGSAHGFGSSGTQQVQLDTTSLTVSPATPSGLYTATVTSTTQIKLTDKTYTSASGSLDIEAPKLNDEAVNEVFGSCVFSDPNDKDEEYIILAANSKAIAVKVSDPSTTYDLAYPTSPAVTVDSPVSMIQAFNKLIIFRDGKPAIEKDLSANNISSSPSLDVVPSGTFTQLVELDISDLDYASGIATATVTSTASLSVGKILEVTTVESSGYSLGDTIIVTEVTNSTTFKFVTDKADDNNKSMHVTLPQSVGLGFTRMPAPSYGVYHQKRLAVPFRYSVDASANSYTDKKIFDEILLSDLLDTNTYDNIFAQFRFNAGLSDFNVGMLSFSDDKLVVFNRNSIHLVQGAANVATATTTLLTDEVGLVAKNSVAQVGSQIIFLSDNGVYGLTFFDRYNLRGTELPLSESIDATIAEINKDAADKAVGVYFNNRYYLAVPIGANYNNTILIYNFLNKQWESIDSINNERFEFTNLLIAGRGTQKGVYVTNKDGGIHKLETEEDGFDRFITEISTAAVDETEARVVSSATTRMYTLKSIDKKRWNNYELHLQSSEDDASDVTVLATTENIDAESVNLTPKGTVGTQFGPFLDKNNVPENAIPAGEDVSIEGRIGNRRGYGLQLTISNTLGRPRLRTVKVAGSETSRSTSSVQ